MRMAEDDVSNVVGRDPYGGELRQQLMLGKHDRRRRKLVVDEEGTGPLAVGEMGAVETGIEHHQAPRGLDQIGADGDGEDEPVPLAAGAAGLPDDLVAAEEDGELLHLGHFDWSLTPAPSLDRRKWRPRGASAPGSPTLE